MKNKFDITFLHTAKIHLETFSTLIKKYNAQGRVTFEILESESISDYNISFGEITIDKPSFNFSANKVSIDGFDIILNNNK